MKSRHVARRRVKGLLPGRVPDRPAFLRAELTCGHEAAVPPGLPDAAMVLCRECRPEYRRHAA